MAEATTASPALRPRKRGTTGGSESGSIPDPNHGTNSNNNNNTFRGENNSKRKKKSCRDVLIVFVFFTVLLSISPTTTLDLDLDQIHSSPQQIIASAATTTTTSFMATTAKAEPFRNETSSQAAAAAVKTVARPPKMAEFNTLSKAGKCVRRIIQHARSVAKNNRSNQPNHGQQQQQQQQPSRKQILYLHPGPPKTATTTIQQLLTDHESELNENNIFLLGKTMPKEKFHCNFPNTPYCVVYQQYAETANNPQNPNSNCTTIMKDQLDQYYNEGADVVLTDEVIGAMFALEKTHKDHQRALDGLQEFFERIVRKNDWEVRVLIGYRPYFDFVKSQFFQLHKAKKMDASTNKWAGRRSLNEWPGKNRKGKHIPPLRNELFRRTWPFSDELVDLFRKHADQVDVFDITTASPRSNGPLVGRQRDIAVRLFCDLLVDATTACDAQKTRSVGGSSGNTTTTTTTSTIEVRENVAVSLDYDRIATAAYQKGLLVVTPQMDRYSVTSRIRDYVEAAATTSSSNGTTTTTTTTMRTGEHDLPLLCPTDESVSKLYNISLAHEMRLFPARNPHWETKGLFETMMNQKKLCSVDVNKVLEMDDWKLFLRALKITKN